jgi:hypothetical protein
MLTDNSYKFNKEIQNKTNKNKVFKEKVIDLKK